MGFLFMWSSTIWRMNPSDIHKSVAWWEVATVITTVVAAVLQTASSALSYVANRKKRSIGQTPEGLEAASLTLAGFASLVALAGAFCVVKYTVANHREQHLAELDNLALHTQLTEAQQQSASASRTANQAASDLVHSKEQLTTITKDLADADQQLADSKARLQRVESQQKWRTLSSRQRKGMIAILRKWKGNWFNFDLLVGDNEVQEFANELDAVFKKAGWQTSWVPTLIFPKSAGKELQEGLYLSFPPGIKEHPEMEKDLIKVVRIADPLAKVIYGENPKQTGPHILIGRKRRIARP